MARRYDKLHRLGSGSYGCAWLVENIEQRSPRRVLKEVHLQTLTEKEVEQALTEVAVLARCKHENIIGYIEAFVDRTSTTLSIVMDFASGGDLDRQICQRYGLYFPNETILRWCAQLMSGLQYIHERGILHRDIKPQNLFLCGKQVLKLGDFGISRVLQDTSDVALTFIGTPYYLSPEICRQQPYDHKSDMWAAGCVMYQLCSLRLPFRGENLPALAAQIQQGYFEPIPSHCGEGLSFLVNNLLVSDPNHRLSADEVLQSKYLKGSQLMTEDSCSAEKRRPVKNEKENMWTNKVMQELNRDYLKDEKSGVLDSDMKRLVKRVNSETYTVAHDGRMRRQSLASPELTAMLERQRTHSVERQRAASADSRRPTLKVDRRAAPRFNLLKDHQQTLLDKKRGVCEEKEDQVHKVSADLPQCFLQRVHRCVQAGSSSCVIASLLKSHVSSRLHTDRAKRVLDAVKDKEDFFCLLQLCNYDKEALTCALWYGVLMS